MTLDKKMLKLLETLNDGYRFLQIRFMLEDVERKIEEGNPLAIQFAKELDHVLGFCEAVTKSKEN
jgi:hypothetical protein